MSAVSVINNVRNAIKTGVNNTSNFIQNNKVGIAATIVSGGAGAIKGAVTKTGLHFSKEAARKATINEIKNGAINGAKSGVIKGVLGNTVVQAVLDPDGALNKTKVGKAINNEIQYATKCINTGVDRAANSLIKLIGGGSK